MAVRSWTTFWNRSAGRVTLVAGDLNPAASEHSRYSVLEYDASASQRGVCEVFRDEAGDVAVVELTVDQDGQLPEEWQFAEALGAPASLKGTAVILVVASGSRPPIAQTGVTTIILESKITQEFAR